MSTASRVAVVGAGLAGLRAAWLLAQRGLDVVAYEASAAVGGRARGEWHAGHWMDAAWPVLDAGNATLLRWIAQLGLADDMLPLRPVQAHAWHSGRAHRIEPTTLRGAAWIPGWPALQTPRLLRWPRLMARYAKLLDARAPERAASLDFRSVRDHVELYFGRAALDCWLTPELQASYGDSVGDLSRVALLQFARVRGLGGWRPGVAGLPRRPIAELAEAVAEGVRVVRGTRVERIDEEPAGGFRIEATDDAGGRSAAWFEAVVVAVPAREVMRIAVTLLSIAERDVLVRMRERPVAVLAAALEGAEGGVPREVRFSRGDDSKIAAFVVEPGQLLGRAPEGHSQLVALLRDDAARQALEETDDAVVKQGIRAIARARRDIEDRLIEARLFRATAPSFEVGHYRRLDRFFAVQRDRRELGRRLYFAGDHLSGGGFEAAVLSGERAANELVSDLDATA